MGVAPAVHAGSDRERVICGPCPRTGVGSTAGSFSKRSTRIGCPTRDSLDRSAPAADLAMAFDRAPGALQRHEELIRIAPRGESLDEGPALARALRSLETNGALDAAHLPSVTGMQRNDRLERRLDGLATEMPFAFTCSTVGSRRVWRVEGDAVTRRPP